jgi:tetratricopeptide (TPR) repeat protein
MSACFSQSLPQFDYQEMILRQMAGSPSPAAKPLTPDAAVSVASLLHHPPDKAVNAFQRSLKHANSGEWEAAARDLEKALATDPGFADAYGNLGVCYLQMHNAKSAAIELRRAIELDPAPATYHVNLAIALTQINRREEAETEARKAVDLDSSNTKGQYLLGLFLAQRPETRAKAAQHLLYAAREVPDAHYVLAALYRMAGDEALAQTELHRYHSAFVVLSKSKHRMN